MLTKEELAEIEEVNRYDIESAFKIMEKWECKYNEEESTEGELVFDSKGYCEVFSSFNELVEYIANESPDIAAEYDLISDDDCEEIKREKEENYRELWE